MIRVLYGFREIPEQFKANVMAYALARYQESVGFGAPREGEVVASNLVLPLTRERYLADGPPGLRASEQELLSTLKRLSAADDLKASFHLWMPSFDEDLARFDLRALGSNPKEFDLRCSIIAVQLDETERDDELPEWAKQQPTLEQAWLSDRGLARWAMALLRWPGRHVDYAVGFARQALCVENITDQRAEDMLRDELHRFCRELGSRLELTPEAAAARYDSNLALSCLLFEALESIGPTGARWARALQKKERQAVQQGWRGWSTWLDVDTCSEGFDPWVGWYRTTSPAMCGITEALWADRVKAHWERERRHSAGVTSPVLSMIRDFTRSGPRTIEATDNAALIFDEQRQIATTDNVPVANIPSLIQTLERGADALMSPVGISLVIGVIISADEEIRRRALDKASPHLEWAGLEQLAAQLGVALNKRALKYLGEALDAGAQLRIEWPGGVRQGLWTYELKRKGHAGGGSSSVLSLVPAAALCPGYYQRLSPSDRLIAPITPLGPLSKSRSAMRPEASLHLELAALLTERSMEIVPRGGVELKDKDITRLAAQVNTSEKVITSALDRWTQDGDDSPAVFERVGKCGYLYADNEVYGGARRFLEHQSQMRLNRQNMGKASRQKKET